MAEYEFKQEIKIGGKYLSEDAPCFVIAEIGLNHNGDAELAEMLIDRAKGCGADAVKFQKRNIDKILTRKALDAPYHSENSYGETYGEHRRALEFTEETFHRLKRCADEKGIVFLVSVWDEDSADFVDELGVPAFKIPSADMTNLPLLEHVAGKGKPLLVSTGMSGMDEVGEAVDIVAQENRELVLLHSVSTYPSEYEEINLKVLQTLRSTFGCLVGYSGHERGIATTEAAVVLGACVVERHFTLDRTMKGPDHAASLEPQGLLKLVRDIRNIERAMGSSVKCMQEEERAIRAKLAKSIVAAVDIPKGATISRGMLALKSPGSGLPPKQVDSLVGKTAVRDIPADTVMVRGMIE